MNLIIRQAKIIDAGGPYHNRVVDLQLKNGIITHIAAQIDAEKGATVIQHDNLHLSQGWFDSSVSFGEPGFEERETIANGLTVAAKSGFTAVALQPNSYPVIDNQSQVNFVHSRAQGHPVRLFPIGALTKNSEGNDMAELFDMKRAGAVAFGDYAKSMSNANLLSIALQYTQDFDGLVIAFSQDADLKGQGVANEGAVATGLGLKGIPALAEELQVARNLALLEYSGGRLHIPTISTAQSVTMIRNAKAKGLAVSCSVAVHQLVLTDQKLEGFDTRFKVSPPLRTDADRKALIKGLKDGTIDMITSDHNPIDIEHKKMEFDTAKNGTIGLESAFGALMTVLPLDLVIQKLTAAKAVFRNGPAREPEFISENTAADLTLFNPDGKWIFTKDAIRSKSKNTAFLNTAMRGTVYGIISQGQSII